MDKAEFMSKRFHETYTVVMQPKGIKPFIHQLENREIHPEDLFGNISPTKSLSPPNSKYLPMVHMVSLVALLWPEHTTKNASV